MARGRYRADYPIFEKVNVNGSEAHPLWAWLTSLPNMRGFVKWNFTKVILSLSLSFPFRWLYRAQRARGRNGMICSSLWIARATWWAGTRQ